MNFDAILEFIWSCMYASLIVALGGIFWAAFGYAITIAFAIVIGTASAVVTVLTKK